MKLYAIAEINQIVSTVRAALATFHFSQASTITAIRFKTDTPNAGGACIFDVNLDGTTIFADPDDRPQIASGASTGEVTGLSVAYTAYQRITVDLDAVPTGGLGENLYVELELEAAGDGGSITVEEVDGAPSVSNVTKIKVPAGQLTDNGGGVVTVTPLQGATGATGAAGATGATGAAGTNGLDGTVWRNGSGAPSNGTGVNGDYYLNTANGDVYQKAAGAYSVIGNIKGAQGDFPFAYGGSAPTDGQVLTWITANSRAEWRTPSTGGQTLSELILTYAPVGYYKLTEASGTGAADSSGNGRDGTYAGSPTLGVTGLLPSETDKAVTFDGVDDKVTVPANAAFEVSHFTVLAVVKFVSGQLCMIAGYDTNQSQLDGEGWSFYVLTTGVVQCQIGTASGSFHICPGATALTAGTTYLVAMTYDKVNLKVFWGSLATQLAQDGTLAETGDVYYTNPRGLTVGMRHNGVNADLFGQGTLEKIAFIPSALSLAQLQAIRNKAFGL